MGLGEDCRWGVVGGAVVGVGSLTGVVQLREVTGD